MPARGPLAYQRTSLAIFISRRAAACARPLTFTIASCADSAANLFARGNETACLFPRAMLRRRHVAETRGSRVEPGAHRRSAERKSIARPFRADADRRACARRAAPTHPEITWPSVRRRRVHQVRAADHHQCPGTRRLGVERVAQRADGRQQFRRRARSTAAMCMTARKRVVRRLAAVDVVVGVNRLL